MDKTELLESDVGDGARFIQEIAAGGLPVSAAMWIRSGGSWQLYIASPNVEKHGPISVYKFLDATLDNMASQLSTDDIVVANTTNHFVNSISAGLSVSEGIVRIVNCTFSGTPVDEAIVYQVRRNVKPSPTPPKVARRVRKRVQA